MAGIEQVPKFQDFIRPSFESFKQLGGSGTTQESLDLVTEIMALSDEILEVKRTDGSSTSLAAYRCAWARNYLKRAGILVNVSHGVWALTEKGRALETVDPELIVEEVNRLERRGKAPQALPAQEGKPEEVPEEDFERWQDEVLEFLRQLHPSAFERVAALLLRKAGFVRVAVTGRSGDGGIDGMGVLRMGGMLSFKVMFQCKRYAGSVSPREIREFQAAMLGRADKGLFVTTGDFTKSARDEAARDGAPAIDLVDGNELCELLKQHQLGVRTELQETIILDQDWLSQV